MAGLVLLVPAAAARPHRGKPAATEQRDQLAPSDEPGSRTYIPSQDTMRVMNWVAASGDNHGVPYMIVDKVAAEVFVFDSMSQLIAASPALVGMEVGDDSTPGVGDRELSDIPPEERTTPAGRFAANFGHAYGGRHVLWVDYPTAISLHAVITTHKAQHRLERLKSPTPEDNRITFGCINVPKDFYAKVVRPLFKDSAGVVYILPETRPLNEVFLAMPPQSPIAAALPASP
jgi:hypothetical protein